MFVAGLCVGGSKQNQYSNYICQYSTAIFQSLIHSPVCFKGQSSIHSDLLFVCKVISYALTFALIMIH